MFERLNMLTDAAYIYNEIATLYLTVLTALVILQRDKELKIVNIVVI